MIRIEDFGEIGYGGVVTLTEWWDNKRIDEGKIGTKDVFKKASFYTYLGVGLAATLMSVFGWMRRYERWSEHVSHGFLYDLPRFAYNLTKALGSSGKRGRGSESSAVQEAQRILNERMRAKALTQGSGIPAERSYQQEFETVAPHAF
ncbi:hypothetical protein KKE60_07465 [Patescibacteria group bacterium]|nr:hypothetical protein [Patescibacteria group bacterium]